MSSSAINNNNQVAAKVLPANPFSDWKSTVNLDPNTTVVSNLPNDVATLILSYLPVEQAQTIMEGTETQMDRYNVYRGIMGDAHCLNHNEHAKSSYTGQELEKFQQLLSLKGQDLINGLPPQVKPWAELLAGDEMSLTRLKTLDFSDSPNMTDLADVIVLTKSSPNLTTLILPGALPSDEVMAVLRANCPQAAIYPSAMTEEEWAHPAEFVAKLPLPPREIADFINSPRPIWEGKTSAEIHMVMPKVNKIVRTIDGRSVMVPWTLGNVNKLDKETGGVGILDVWEELVKKIQGTFSNVGFEWVVFTKDALPTSRNQTFGQQKELVKHWGYEMPDVIEATTCMLWENRLSGNRIYSDNPHMYTRCKKQTGSLIAGGFGHQGMQVITFLNADNDIGVGGIRKFKG